MGTLGLGPVGVALNVSGSYLAEAAEAERLGEGGQPGPIEAARALAGR